MSNPTTDFAELAKLANDDQTACEIGKELLEEGMKVSFERWGRRALIRIGRKHPDIMTELKALYGNKRKDMALYVISEQRTLDGKRPVELLAEGNSGRVLAALKRAAHGHHI